jgi:putative DNA methylase
MTTRRKLIEVALPLDAINRAAAYEKMPGIGAHPRGLHLWWARRPLAACRAVIFASLVDDPGEPGAPEELLEAIDRLPWYEREPADVASMSDADRRREKLFQFIAELVKWESSTDEQIIGQARELIRIATGGNPPPLLDPFCGGGSIPLEGQRLGLQVYASELNPVAVLITKALVEIPPKFAGRPPVNPDDRKKMGQGAAWKGAAGLAADVRWYGKWMRDRAWERIGHLYPKGPNSETVIAWLWARTVKCPNPACGAQMPLVRSFWLSTKKGKEAWVEPIVDGKTVRFEVRRGTYLGPHKRQRKPGETCECPNCIGSKCARGAKFFCLSCGEPAEDQHIKDEGMAGRMGAQALAVVAEGQRSRVYLSPDSARFPDADPPSELAGMDAEIANDPRAIWCKLYGLTTFADLFTPRQLVAATTFSDLVGEARALALEHARQAGLPDDGTGIADGGAGATAYADAIATYLAFALDRLADFNSGLTRWVPSNEKVMNTFARQALPMVWDFSEANPLAESVGGWLTCVEYVADCLEAAIATHSAKAAVQQLDSATALPPAHIPFVFTDPPYYDNIGYADLSDFLYVWLRRTLGRIYPDLFATVLTPKGPELVATPYRFNGDKAAAERHFEEGLEKAFTLLRERAHHAYPLSIIYAFKQREEQDGGLTGIAATSTAWETMLGGLIGAGFRTTGTWPMRTEQEYRMVAMGTNALASAVVLACRPRPEDAPIATRREFQQRLREELPKALRHLMGGHIAPVDLAQAAIGPGMAVFSSYSRVLEADGSPMSVRAALQLINRAIEDYFTEQEGELDPDTQFCARWFEQHGFNDGPYGEADVLARAKAIGVDGLERDGILEAKGGKVRLKPLSYYLETVDAYDPVRDRRPTVWEACHYLIAALDRDGEQGAARLARRLGGLADLARDLAYRLYDICDRKGWAEPALGYNALVASWPEIVKQAARLAQETEARLPGI